MTKQKRTEGIEDVPVGYCRPPRSTRFQPGRSGNPRGRPRGTLNLSTVLERTLREKVFVEIHGKRKAVTRLEAAIERLVSKAVGGNLTALHLLAGLMRYAEERAVKSHVPNSELSEPDQKTLLRILERFEQSVRNESGGCDEPERK